MNVAKILGLVLQKFRPHLWSSHSSGMALHHCYLLVSTKSESFVPVAYLIHKVSCSLLLNHDFSKGVELEPKAKICLGLRVEPPAARSYGNCGSPRN